MAFEAYLDRIFKHWRTAGVARIEKTDPPMRIARGKAIHLKNPWLDYFGSWKGRAIAIEAKSRTKAPTKPRDDHWLPLCCKTGGMTEKQITTFLQWDDYQATAVILWQLQGDRQAETRIFPASLVREVVESGLNRLYWPEGIPMIELDGVPSPFHTIDVGLYGRKS